MQKLSVNQCTERHTQIQKLTNTLAPLQHRLINHPVYQIINTTVDLNIFMEFQVYTVWSSLALTTCLQQKLNRLALPIVPEDASALVNERPGEDAKKAFMLQPMVQYFKQYYHAMRAAGTDTVPLDHFLLMTQQGLSPVEAIGAIDLPVAISHFLEVVSRVTNRNKSHEMAAILGWGRENLVPNTFVSLVREISGQDADSWKSFIDYLTCQGTVDKNFPDALSITENLCGDDLQKWHDCHQVLEETIQARLVLWDTVVEAIELRIYLSEFKYFT